MEIWLKTSDDKLKIPVLPSSYEVTSPQNDETVTTVDGTEIILIGEKGLRSISWSCFLPKGKPSYLCKNHGYNGKPWTYINRIGKMKTKVIILQMTGTNINYPVKIVDFRYGEQDGSGSINYTIQFKEYPLLKGTEKNKSKSVKKETVNTKTTKAKKPETKTNTKEVKTKTYIVKKGDTLTGIAKKQTGTSANWKAIYNANKKTIGSNPNKIYPGQKLVIKV